MRRAQGEAVFSERVTPDERRWVLVFAVIVMALTSLPYFLGFANQGAEWRFSGFVLGVEDANTYIAKMLSGAAGAWLFRSPYSALPQKGVLALPFYIWLGKLSAPPGQHVQLLAIYHWFRILAGILAIWGSYAFLSQLVESPRWRRYGSLLITLGGGYGWLVVLSGNERWLDSLPLEYYSPESFGFLGLFGFPHLALARAALLWGLTGYLVVMQSGKSFRWQSGIKIGVWWLVLAAAQPMIAVVFGGILALHLGGTGLWQWWRGRQGLVTDWGGWKVGVQTSLLAGCLPTPFILYNVYIFSTDPYLIAWTAQNRIFSPHPLHYLLAFGWILPFAIGGALILMHTKPWQGWLLSGWLLSIPFLAYAPVNLQRRLPEGVWVVLVTLGIAVLEDLSRDSRQQRVTRAGFLALSAGAFPSTILLLIGGVAAVQAPAPPIFLPAEEVKAFQYLAEQARPGAVVLSAYDTGNALPAWATVRVVIGHGPESANLAALEPRVDEFFQRSGSDEERLELILEQEVDYIFWGPLERSLGEWDPRRSQFLASDYQSAEYEIFRVTVTGKVTGLHAGGTGP